MTANTPGPHSTYGYSKYLWWLIEKNPSVHMELYGCQ